MITVAEALISLGIDGWKLVDEPVSKEQFNDNFFKFIGVDENGTAIESSNPENFGVTWEEIQAEVARLTALEPVRISEANRKAAYEQEADPLFFKWQAGETTKEEWEAKRAEIRARFPK